MRSLLFSLLLSSTLLLLASASPTDETSPPVLKTSPAPAVVDEVKTTPAAENKVETTAAPVEEVKTTPAAQEDAKSTAPVEEKIKSTVAPAEEAKVTPAVEEKKEVKPVVDEVKATTAADEAVKTTAPVEDKARSTAAPEEEEEEDKATVAPVEATPKKLVMPVENAEKAKEDTVLVFDRSLLGHKDCDKAERFKRRKEILKKIVPESISAEEVATQISDGEPAVEEKAISPEEVKTFLSDPIVKKVTDILSDPVVKKEAEAEQFFKKLPRENAQVVQIFKRLVMPRENAEVLIGKPKFDFTKIGTGIKSAGSFENLRAGRGLINIERIDKIDVTVYTYAKEK